MDKRKKMIGIVLIWGVLGALYFTGIYRDSVFSVREAEDQKVLSALTARVEGELGRFTQAIEAMLRIIAKWGMTGELDSGGVPSLCVKVLPLLDEYRRVSGLILATGRGKEIALLKQGNQWALELSGIDPSSIDLTSVPGLAKRVAAVRSSAPDYDPRSRPWFRKAAMGGAGGLKAAWTAPYRFFGKDNDGITASMGWRDDEGVDHIVAADVLLRDFIDFIASLDPGPQARLFLAKADRSLIFPAKPEGPFLALIEQWARDAKSGDGKPLGDGTLSFLFQGRKWRVETRSLEKQKEQLIFGVLMPVPERTFRLRVGGMAGFLLTGAWFAVLGIFLWRFYPRSVA